MSSNLRRKLLRQATGQIPSASSSSSLVDIEECCADTKSEYFSPVQTRRQRRVNGNPPKPPLIDEKRMRTDKHADAPPPWQPPHWRQVLANVREMRSNADAPVDTMGCHKCADSTVDEKTQRFHILVALMLSSQTKDETTHDAVQRLTGGDGGLTPAKIIDYEIAELENLLRPVSFFKTKASHLQKTSRILLDTYAADIPRNVKELVALPGVGPKMAHICMAAAWKEITGIGVDVHVHRISNRLGWVPCPTKEPEKTRVALEAWLPRALWAEVNHLLVGFGQTVCKPVSPNCSECLNREICPAAETGGKKSKIMKDKKLLSGGKR